MPIAVQCHCGKAFNVKDEAAGTKVNCQICGLSLQVPNPSPAAPPAVEAAVPVPTKPEEQKLTCPACAEDIPADAAHCPFCRESLVSNLSKDQLGDILHQQIKELNSQPQDTTKQGFLSGKTVVLGAISALSLLLIMAGAILGGDAVALVGLAAVVLIIFSIAFLVSILNDHAASNIQEGDDPAITLKRFLKAAQSKRSQKAFNALTPSAQKVGLVDRFQLAKIPNLKEQQSISSVETFQKYWHSVFRGPSMYTRNVRVTKPVADLKRGGQVAIVEATVNITSYPTPLIILIVINIVVVVLAILIVQKKETLTIRKLLIKSRGKWYIAEPTFEGALDQIELS